MGRVESNNIFMNLSEMTKKYDLKNLNIHFDPGTNLSNTFRKRIIFLTFLRVLFTPHICIRFRGYFTPE